MKSIPNQPAHEDAAQGAEKPMTPERALIMNAFDQVEQASSWTPSQQGSSPNLGSEPRSGSMPVSHDAPTLHDSSFTSAPKRDELPGPDAFPGYEITREIHRGGQGVVYLANQIATKRRIALKVMHGGATLGATGRIRFDREVQLLGQLNHPNIVKLHDSGVTPDGSFFYVMDYISGRPLDEILREQRKQRRDKDRAASKTTTKTKTKTKGRSRSGAITDVDETIRFFARICDGVNAAHLKGVIHRDIKPANIRIDSRGEPILVDFGLAKLSMGMDGEHDSEAQMTQTGQFIGSLPWASPEQASGQGNSIDVRTDVYSLGVVLYQMLTGGRFPYAVLGNMRDVLDNIQRVEPARPSTIRKQINDEIETIVLKALNKEPDRRYQSAGELARDLRRYLAGEPIEAKRDAGWYVIRKTLRRHRTAVAFAATVAILVTGAGIAMGGLWRQAESARILAVSETERAEENLDAVRDLANTFLYDFHDSIEHLRGATQARGVVLEKALQYLAMLAAQPDPSRGNLADLADAHERVGDLLGGMYAANTGTTSEAMTHYQAALEIRSALLEADPTNTEITSDLARTWILVGEAHHKANDYTAALSSYEVAATMAETVGDTKIVLDSMTRTADTHRRMAVDEAEDPQAFAARTSTALGLYEQAAEMWRVRGGADAPRAIALLDSKKGQTHLLIGRIAANDPEQLQAASDSFQLGRSLSALAIDAFRALRAENPTSFQLNRDVWVDTTHLGQSFLDTAKLWDRAGQPDRAQQDLVEALAQFRQAEAIATEMTADPSNLEALRDLAVTMNKVGNTLLALDRVSEARAIYAINLERRRNLYRSDPVERHLRDLGVGAYKVAQADEKRAELATSDAERGALLELSRSSYIDALESFQQFTDAGGSGEGLIRAVRADIARITDALGS